LSDRFNTYLKTLPKEEQKQKNLVFQKVCEQWLDVRAFGQVFAHRKTGQRILGIHPLGRTR
jgi:CRISPR-associated protein Csd2